MLEVILIIIFSLIVHLACYFYISRKEKNYFNIFFLFIFNVLPVSFVLEPLYIYYNGLFGSVYSYVFIYLSYAFNILAIVIGYRFIPDKLILKLPFSRIKSKSLIWGTIFIVAGFLVYLPVLIEFKEYIFQPREIYVRTRTGYGIFFFVSSSLSIIGFIIILFSRNVTVKIVLIAFVTVSLFLYLHGSKGQVVTIFIITALYYVYIKDWKIGIKKIALISTTASLLILGLFYLTTSYEYDNIFQILIGYSDYNRNAMLVIDNKNQNLYYGQLTYESNFYSRIPRILMPNKPKEYGGFRLAKQYFPDWFYAETGDPAFGIGVAYADFSDFAIIYELFFALLTGALVKIFINRLKLYKSPGDFIVVLFLSNISLISIGAAWLLPEHLFLAFFVNMILAIKVKVRG